MPRRRPPDRLDQVVDSAARVFRAKGYRRTQMADVAREMGVAPGTLYNYVTSKEALFHLVIDRAFVDEPPPVPEVLPLATPAPAATLTRLRERLLAGTHFPLLEAALNRRSKADDPRSELEAIVREMYDRVERTRLGGALIERSALDMPALAALWFGEIRHRFFVRLADYLGRRMQAGHLRRMPDPAAAARLVVEVITFFARHRHSDPDPSPFSETVARETAVEFIVAALAPAAAPKTRAPSARSRRSRGTK